jgi:hypothetical protein
VCRTGCEIYKDNNMFFCWMSTVYVFCKNP